VAIVWHQSHEAPEGLHHTVQRAVVVQVVGLYVGDHGEAGTQLQKTAVKLIGLSHEVETLAGAPAALPLRQLAAHHAGGI